MIQPPRGLRLMDILGVVLGKIADVIADKVIERIDKYYAKLDLFNAKIREKNSKNR